VLITKTLVLNVLLEEKELQLVHVLMVLLKCAMEKVKTVPVNLVTTSVMVVNLVNQMNVLDVFLQESTHQSVIVHPTNTISTVNVMNVNGNV
jgi:hypothetical protein